LADVWAVARAIADRAGGDPGFPGLAGDADLSGRIAPRRIALLQTGGWSSTSDEARQAFEAARTRFTSTKVELRSRADDPDIEALEQAITDALTLTQAINAWEGRWPLNTYADIDASKLSAPARERLKIAEAMTQSEYGDLVERRDDVRSVFAKAASRYDGFLTLGACGAAPVGLGMTGNTVMNVAASLLGCPALTVPVLHDGGLPLGLQMLAGMGRDAALFSMASWILLGRFDRSDLVGKLT
jgi:Asp-tRNA(Asn)/Glu-tRNA(Gln) amidotransferase A subunit family amidase